MLSKEQLIAAVEQHFANIGSGDRESFLNHLADNCYYEDPVGPTPNNPEGRPLSKADVAHMWDVSSGSKPTEGGYPEPKFNVDKFICCGNEVCCLMTATSWLPRKGTEAEMIEVKAEGAYIYTINDEGKIEYVKAYFDYVEAYGETKLCETSLVDY